MNPLRLLENRRLLAGVAAFAALLALGFWPSAAPVDLASVDRGPLRVSVDEEGETRVRERFVVSAPVAGRVQRIALLPGDRVTRDTVVATLLPAAPTPLDARSRAEAEAAAAAARTALGTAQAERGRAQAAARLAASERTRHRALAEEQLVSRQTLEAQETSARAADEALRAAEFAVATSRHQYEMARARLQPSGAKGAARALVLRSPLDGVVFKRLRESEAVVPAGEPLLVLGDPRQLEVVSDLLSSDAVKVKPGALALLEQWGGDHPIRARVRTVEPSGFMKVSALGVEEQRVNVVMDFEDPLAAWSALGDGYRVEVRIVVWESASVLRVPTSSLFRQGEDWAVFAVADGRARLRTVTIGHRNGSSAELLGGLAEGARVVLHPSDTLKPGVRVKQRPS